MAVSVSADASLTIGEVTFVKDTTNNLVTFTVPYTAVEVDQITVIAVKGPADEAPAATEANIVYFNQQSSASDSFTFSVALDAFNADAPYCWIKIGGTAIATASSDGGQEIWANAAPVLVYGDVNEDGEINVSDVTAIIALVQLQNAGTEIDATKALLADVNGKDGLNVSDITMLIEYVSKLNAGGTDTLDPVKFPDGKFPAYAN
jgi:hypothetical protein